MASALTAETDKDVLPWLQLAEDLRMLNLDCELNMPQICVMGDQSSGKSSVLEALSGIPFPRGSGLVTRCPIRMVMKRSRQGTQFSAAVSTSGNPEQTMAYDISELNILIDQKMREVCKEGNNFSTESVIVDLVSPDACDLTVVDLPGIIRTVTTGQNVDSIKQVNSLIKSYLMDKRTIILAVIPANQDIATVDILERAQSVDPSGQRTIGVVTKTDLVGPGSEEEVVSVVTNVRKPLALGYVMVKNRTQKDIQDKISTSRARDLETEFFQRHSVFKKVNPQLVGITQLSKKLTLLLLDRIKTELAPMRSLVDKLLGDVRAEMRLFPSSTKLSRTTAERQKLFVATVQDFVRQLADSVRGEYRERVMVRNPELRLFAQAMLKFEEFQLQVQGTAPQFRDDEYVENLSSQIEEFRGRELPGFMSSQAFYMCMSQYVDRWQEPISGLVTEVRNVALEVAVGLSSALLQPYPALQQAIREVVATVLDDSINHAQDHLQDVLSREKDPFTLNDFLQQWVNKLRYDRFSSAVEKSFEEAKHPASNWNALKEEIYISMRQWYRTTHAISARASAQEMTGIMEAYWNLSAKRFVDNCCMTVDKDILGILPDAIQDHMFQFIKEDDRLKLFFTESPELVAKKAELESKRERLSRAAEKLAAISSTIV
jgi:interferon-induced GTP-binding protein Mx1